MASASSVLLFIATIPLGLANGTDESADFRFAVDDVVEGPELTFFKDNTDEGCGATLCWARTGLSGNHKFAVQWRTRVNTSATDTGRDRTFQVIEITNASILVDKSSLAADAAVAGFTDIVGLTDTQTVASTGSILILLGNMPQVFVGDESFALRFTIAGSFEGPEPIAFSDVANLGCGNSIMWLKTGISGSTAFALQWDETQASANADTGRLRTFQVIEITADAILRDAVVSQTAHSLTGSFADIPGLTTTFIPKSTDSIIVLASVAQPLELATDHCGAYRFADGGTLEGPQMYSMNDNTPAELCGHFVYYAVTGKSVTSHTFTLQGINIKNTVILDTTRNRSLCALELIAVAVVTVPIQTIVEIELAGRGQGWTDVSADLGDRAINIDYGINGNGITDRVASAGAAKFELVNQNPEGKYSLRHANKLTGFALGIGVRIRLLLTIAQGTGSLWEIDNAGGHPAGTTTSNLGEGSGSMFKGDIVTFAGVAGKYIIVIGGDPQADLITWEPGLAVAVADEAAVTLVGRSFTRHRGRIDSANPIPGVFERRTVRVESVDWMDDAARSKTSLLAVQVDKRADEIFTTLVGSVPFQPDAIEADVSPDTYSFALDSAQDEKSAVLSELQKLAISELGLIYQKADGTVVFESRTRRAVSEGVVDTFTDVSTISKFAAPVARDDAISRVQVITHPRKVDATNNTVLFRLDNPLQIGAGSSVTILGPYRDPNQEAARVGGTDMVTPVAGTDYSANSQSDGAGTDLTSFIALTVNFGGNGARVKINNNGSTTAFLTLMQLRGRGIFDYQNVVLEAEDANAQINVGTTATADMPYQDDAVLGEEMALWLLGLYKDADALAQSATVFIPRSDDVLANRILSREISDRIEIVEQMTGFVASPTGGHFIQSVSLTIDARENLSITWGLAPANRQQFWLLEIPGRSELDQTAVLGFGLVVGHTDVDHCDTHDDTTHADVDHDDTHGDAHDDVGHSDAGHTDTHTDDAHIDAIHTDSHSDTTHGDASHSDSHSDVLHLDTHSDVTHADVAHGDIDHADHVDS